MPPRSALLVAFNEEDVAWAVEQNRYACLIVRAVQRRLPDALRVTADSQHISFSLPDDGEDGIRYVCDTDTPLVENVIKPFDGGKIKRLEDIPEGFRSFTLVAREAKPMQHRTKPTLSRAERIERRERQRKTARTRTRSRSAAVRTYNRFLDSQADEGGDDE
jgi:hypothetical protein